jgi:hypothetical protein
VISLELFVYLQKNIVIYEGTRTKISDKGLPNGGIDSRRAAFNNTGH